MKTKFSKTAAILLAIALVTALVPANAEAAAKRKVSLYVSKGTTLKAVSGAKWKSSNKKVATVSKKGKVKAKKAGKATISAKKGKRTWKFTVTVKNPYLNQKAVRLSAGSTKQVRLAGASIKKCTSSNPKVATATWGANALTIKAVGAGHAVISVMSSSGKMLTCGVTVPSVSDNGRNSSLSSPSPTSAAKDSCQERGYHIYDSENPLKVWYVPCKNDPKCQEKVPNYHRSYMVVKCKYCDHTIEKLKWQGECAYTNDRSEWKKDMENWELNPSEYTVVKEPTCTEDGKRYKFCPLCGGQQENANWCVMPDGDWEYFTTIPHLGHDLVYDYKREISVQPGWTNRDYPGASKAVMENPFGERTATCKRCHKSWDEVGIDTGTELNDGSREIVWGVWRQDKNAEILKEINAYRTGQTGITREPLQASEPLNRAAVYILAEKMQMWTKYGSPAEIMRLNGRDRYRLRELVSQNFTKTQNCYDFEYANKEYNTDIFTNCDLMNSAFRFNTDIKYAGVACFDIETLNGDFQMGVMAVGRDDEILSYDCHHNSAYELAPIGSSCIGESEGLNVLPCLKCTFNWDVDPD